MGDGSGRQDHSGRYSIVQEADNEAAAKELTGLLTPEPRRSVGNCTPVGRRSLKQVEFIGLRQLTVEEEEYQAAVARKQGTTRQLTVEEEEYQAAVARKQGTVGRYALPRMSLLGKPIGYRATRRAARYRHFQMMVYNFLERPAGWSFVLHRASGIQATTALEGLGVFCLICSAQGYPLAEAQLMQLTFLLTETTSIWWAGWHTVSAVDKTGAAKVFHQTVLYLISKEIPFGSSGGKTVCISQRRLLVTNGWYWGTDKKTAIYKKLTIIPPQPLLGEYCTPDHHHHVSYKKR
ncbi:Potassium voltage-gated channel sub KQT member 4 [Branchiostoma belcheri]|nr:Potassium voltage-gated channel sub KQT member 4 [Branchiostoma belcheri]